MKKWFNEHNFDKKKYVKICQDEGFKHRFGTSEHLELFISKSQNPKRRNKTLLQKGNFPISENSANLRHFSHSNSPRCCRKEHPAPTAAGHSAPTHPGTAANDQRIPRADGIDFNIPLKDLQEVLRNGILQ